MKRRNHQARVFWLALFLGLAGFVAAVILAIPSAFAQAAPGTAALAARPAEIQKPDNSACLACHEKPGQSMTLPSGEVLSISVDPISCEDLGRSVHMASQASISTPCPTAAIACL